MRRDKAAMTLQDQGDCIDGGGRLTEGDRESGHSHAGAAGLQAALRDGTAVSPLRTGQGGVRLRERHESTTTSKTPRGREGARKGLAETRREEARRKQRDGIAGSSRTPGFAEREGDLFSKVQELMDRWAMSKFTKVLSPKIAVLYVPLTARNQASSRGHSTVVASTRRTCQGRPQGGPAERGGAGKNDPTTQF